MEFIAIHAKLRKGPEIDAGQSLLRFFAYLTTLPPAAVHSLAEALLFQPMPLQLFWPLHSFLAVLQSDVPLQLFRPAQCTDMSSAAWATVRGAPMANKAAAALAMAIADLKLDDMVFPLTKELLIEVKLQSGLVPWMLFASACYQ
jgi:hypothetical protein